MDDLQSIAHFNLPIFMTSPLPTSLPIESTLQTAIAHHQSGRLQEAEQLYHAILQVLPEQPDANHNMGILACQTGQAAAGLPYLKKAWEGNPLQEQYALSYANALSAAGKPAEALEVLQTSSQRGVETAELHNNLGNLLREFGHLEAALISLRKALALRPDFAVAHYNAGSVLQQLGQSSEAAASYRQALAINPEFTEAHNNLGISQSRLGQLDAAPASFQRAIELRPDYAEAWYNLGNARRDLGRLDDAATAYRQALAIQAKSPETQANLGHVLRDMGRLEEATRAYEAAIALHPGFIDAHYELSALKTYRQGDAQLEYLEQLIQQAPAWPADTQVHYWFALGKMREDLGRYDEAFAAYNAGNRLQRSLLPPGEVDDTREDAMQVRILSVFSKDFFASRTGSARKVHETQTAPIFIVGMPRSGTSLLEQILASYHGIYGAGELTDLSEAVTAAMPASDFSHFPEAVADLKEEDFASMGAQYAERIARLAPEAGHIVDKMPANFHYIGMIHLALPSAKIIHAMRDPVDTCFSCYARLFSGNNLGFTYDLESLGRYYVRYARLMQHWKAVLPAGTILNLSYEDLVSDIESQARRLLAYLGLPWDDRCLAFHENQRHVATASAAQVRRPIYRTSLARWRRFERHLAPLLDIIKDSSPV